MTDFQVNEVVDVIDLRDGAVIKRNVTITKLEQVRLTGRPQPSTYATLSTGYAVSVKCLRKTGSSQ